MSKIKSKGFFFGIFLLLLVYSLLVAGCNDHNNDDGKDPVEETATPISQEIEDPFEDSVEEEPADFQAPDEEAGDLPSEVPGNPAPSMPAPSGEENLPVIVDGDYLMVLVSKEATLKSDYIPSGLQPVPDYMRPYYSMQLRQVALEPLKELFQAADEDGVELHIRSAYRSYATQKSLFADYASRHGATEANRFSARPGQSEHQLGTTVDFGGTNVDFSANFAGTPQGRWLKDNAHKFGFVMSYPEGMEAVTGYIYEPWHFRYIGVDEAARFLESGVTLTEYLKSRDQNYE